MKNTLRFLYKILTFVFFVSCSSGDHGKDPLPSWHEGAAKEAIIRFVKATTDKASPDFVPSEDRIATFDQDGTLWVEHPIYTQIEYCFDRVAVLAKKNLKLKDIEPFKTVLSGNKAEIAKLSLEDLEKIALAALTGISTEEFEGEVKSWLAKAKDERWKRPYTELTYQPMQEVLHYLRDNGFKTYIVTGGGQDFVRVYSMDTYGIPKEQVVGTAGQVKFSYNGQGKALLIKEPKVLLNDNFAGKPEGIQLMIGKRPIAAFGNSTGDREMREYTKSGGRAALSMLVLHDDGEREYLYGPAKGLPFSKIGTFTEDLYLEAQKSDWVVISMKNDWKKVFSFEESKD